MFMIRYMFAKLFMNDDYNLYRFQHINNSYFTRKEC